MRDEKQDEIVEYRKYVRIPRRYIIRCSPFTAKDFLSPGRDKITEGLLKNISCGGILFESKVRYDVGILLRIELALPGWERFKSEFFKEGRTPHSDPLTVLVHVVRLEVLEDGLFDIGACFSAIDEGDKWTLFKYIQNYTR
ncbi:MAG: PilZ domain-containing protein [Candidatus Omnitrophota bacterium]|jgi:hypothetical protein